MGVMRKGSEWALVQVNNVSTKATGLAKSELNRTLNILVWYRDSLLHYAGKIKSVVGIDYMIDLIGSIIEKILRLSPCVFGKEALYRLYNFLATTMEQLLLSLLTVTTPLALRLRDFVAKAISSTRYYIMITFDKMDNSCVTPIVNCGADTGLAVFEGVIVPALGYTVAPIYRNVTYVASGALTKTVQMGAFLDRKLSLVDMMWAVTRMSQKVDQCVTKGRVENWVVHPLVGTAESVDNKLTGGAVKTFCKDTVQEFEEARGKA